MKSVEYTRPYSMFNTSTVLLREEITWSTFCSEKTGVRHSTRCGYQQTIGGFGYLSRCCAHSSSRLQVCSLLRGTVWAPTVYTHCGYRCGQSWSYQYKYGWLLVGMARGTDKWCDVNLLILVLFLCNWWSNLKSHVRACRRGSKEGITRCGVE